jgi:chemotaxis protein methyltransferase CheR
VTTQLDDVERFRSLLSRRLGLTFEDRKLSQLGELLEQRMAHAGCDRFADYELCASLPRHADDERRAWAAVLTVGETFFLRFADQFKALTDMVIPDRMSARRSKRSLRDPFRRVLVGRRGVFNRAAHPRTDSRACVVGYCDLGC